jgi:ATP-binding cassette subfamily F protein uup
MEQRELESLPARIEALESEQRTLNETIAAAEFYKERAETINDTLARLDALQHELTAAYTRWDDLESRTMKN